uniref:NR LBD domain-containing protein n=1 Tax=Mustela putorius furo TaxID=9669 RepID=M3YM06_MUSPF
EPGEEEQSRLRVDCMGCGNMSSGKHRNFTGEGRESCFQQSIHSNRSYTGGSDHDCQIDQDHLCQYCLLRRCSTAASRTRCLAPWPPPWAAPPGWALAAPGREHFPGQPVSELIAQLLGAKPNPALSRRFSAGAFGADGAGRCEAVGLLFSTVEWARHAPFFPELPVARQVALLRPRWSELFHCASVGTAPARGAAPGRALHAGPFTHQVRAFQEQVDKLGRGQVDACLKAIALFTPDACGLSDPAHENLQETAQVALMECVRAQYWSQPQHFGRPLLRLPALRALPASLNSQLFFMRLVGKTPTEWLIRSIGPMALASDFAWTATPLA